MSFKYGKNFSQTKTSQTEPVLGKKQVKNSAGGYVFQVDDWKRLDRFLVLGSEGGSYYASEKKLTQENAKTVIKCIENDGARAVNRIVEVSQAGRAPKNSPAIFALALAATVGDESTKALVYNELNKVCRIGTHLFEFNECLNALGKGWSAGRRRGVANWYLSKEPKDLAYQITKYQQREGWSHRDLLRLCHAKTGDKHLNNILHYAVKGEFNGRFRDEATNYLRVIEEAKACKNEAKLVNLIIDNRLVREQIPTDMLTPNVWGALLEHMPVTAMIRNLGNLTKYGLLTPLSKGMKKVVSELTNIERLKKGRVHPLTILVALKTYASGHGDKGSNSWNPVGKVTEALDDAFYLAFDAVEPTNKNWLFGIDVSCSMSSQISGMNISCCEAATVLALVGAHTEPWSFVGRFNTGFQECPFTKKTRLDEAMKWTCSINGGGTDCAMPMVYAKNNNLEVDAFVTLTDSETWAGRVHPFQALKDYRKHSGRDAKLITVGMVSNAFTIADPSDAGMLDVVGFSTDVPALMSEFVGYN